MNDLQKRRLIDSIGDSPTFVAEGVRLTGDLETPGPLVICGAVLYIDDDDKVVHVEDNIGLIELCRTTYEASGLGADYVDQFIR